MTTLTEYRNLVTQQHRDKPQFMATLDAMGTPLVYIQNIIKSLVSSFDIDTATGNQLDIVGQWVGIPRKISVPIFGVYFSWDSTSDEGWDNGVWKAPNDPDSGFTILPDDLYRRVIRAKVMANKSCGCASDIYLILSEIISGASIVKVVDNQDMTVTIQLDVSEITMIEREIIETGILQIQPAGVGVVYEEI
jgi:hypothetical protein